MQANDLLQEAYKLEDELLSIRHYLHSHPGIGFDIEDTYQYVYNNLVAMGYAPHSYGKKGLIATCGHREKGKTILLRADMDALPIQEKTDLSFASKNGNMHACGHDMHTTMLLGAARLLKQHEEDLRGQVILCFQPAEELLEGAKDMIDAGVLRDTMPDAALMIHITANMPLETGSVIVCDGGISAPAADYFEIQIQGKGVHGAMPELGIDPITAAAHIITSLQEIHARELSMHEEAALTIGSIRSGNAANVIPDTALICGTMRAYDETTRALLKTRMQEIITHTATAFRAKATLHFTSGCPTLKNDEKLSNDILASLKDLLGSSNAFSQTELLTHFGNAKASKATGSEDFAYFSHEVDSLMLSITAGKIEDGYIYPLHHPKAIFDEKVLPIGSAVYAYAAISWLQK